MVRKQPVSGVQRVAEVGDVLRKKITAEPILSLDTSPMISGQHLCSPSALSSFFGEDSEAVLLDTAQEPGATVYTLRDVLAWSWYLIVSPFHLPPCPDVLDLLVDFISSLANGIIGISIVFLVFLLPCAFGDLIIIPGILMLPFSTAATVLGFYKSSLQLPSSCTGQLRRCEQLLIPPFRLSQTVTALSQECCFLCTSAYSACLWIAFSALHTGIEDMEMIYFCCSDIIRDMIQQGIYRQVLMTCSKSDCKIPPSSLYLILAGPSLSLQAAAAFLSCPFSWEVFSVLSSCFGAPRLST